MRMIDADKLWKDTTTTIDECEDFLELIEKQPTVDRPHGEWKGYNEKKEEWLRTDGTPIFLVCDQCYGTVLNNGSAHWNFCPNCGAKMEVNE